MAIARGTNPFALAGLGDADALAAKQQAVAFLRARLRAEKMSQTELARRAGLAPSHVSEMLSGRLARFGIDRFNAALAVFGSRIAVAYRLEKEAADV